MCVMYSLFKACNIIMESEAVLLTYITSEYSVWPYLIHIIYKNQDVHYVRLSIFNVDIRRQIVHYKKKSKYYYRKIQTYWQLAYLVV